jgi:catechol 2,3-dioxygenase-like lactoylglutathione lyase family enzyme
MKFFGSLIAVADTNKSKKFYEDIMEQKIETDRDGYIVFNGGFSFILKSYFEELIKGRKIKDHGNNFELYFEHNDIENFVNKLKENNAKFIHEIEMQAWGQKVIRIYDPDNNIIEIGEPMK